MVKRSRREALKGAAKEVGWTLQSIIGLIRRNLDFFSNVLIQVIRSPEFRSVCVIKLDCQMGS